MSDFLDQMARGSAARARRVSAQEVRARLADQRPPIALDTTRFGVIAEIKLASPSKGVLSAPVEPEQAVVQRAKQYDQAGAAAISVLTEPDRFGGSLDHLALASAAVDTPVMRKDFLVDPVQVLEARAAGASGVLLIVRMVDDARLADLMAQAQTLGMFVLLEAFDKADIERAHEHQAQLVGVNCRDLRTLEVQPDRFDSLAPFLPPHVVGVAESGLFVAEDAARVADLGYGLTLVGTALMKASNPAQMLEDMIAAGRRNLEGVTCASA